MTESSAAGFSSDPRYKRVMLLGMDGLDPKLLTALLQKDELPNFARLRDRGGFSPLATSNPAQSPVAWASIATGCNPGYHGIFDFLGRRISDYMPELAILRMNPKNVFGKREAMFLPVMHGDTFWDLTSDNGIPSTILKWPMTFQPRPNRARLFAGLGVPDIKGGLGKYAFYTTRNVPSNEEGADKVVRVQAESSRIRTYISGPNVAKLRGMSDARTDMLIAIIDNSTIEITVAGKKMTVHKDQWSQWMEVPFKLGMMRTASGTVKFLFRQAKPDFELYITPVQINPRDPAFIITNPDSYSRELTDEVGLFYTLGMPEDTKALEEGRTDEDSFIAMCDEIVEEQEKMMWNELNKFDEGLFASAFFSTDRIQHMFWHTIDPRHPLYEDSLAKKYGRVIDDYYRKMDRILGDLIKEVDDRTALMVFSDHGFSSFRRSVHINTWLVNNGFMKLTQAIPADDKDGGPLFKYVDWKQTQAFSLGFGSIYLNRRGREKKGFLDAEKAESVAKDISAKLLTLKDPADGQPAIRNMYSTEDIYKGNQSENAPDLVIGFEDGYRASWQTAIGGAPAELMEDNLKKWSGDHIMDPSVVPGILLTNFAINTDAPNQMDIAPTVLSCLGMSDGSMDGKSLL